MGARRACAIAGTALPVLALACNGVLGIGTPTAVDEPSEAGSQPQVDAAAPDATVPPAVDASTSEAASPTTDAGVDAAASDAASDAPGDGPPAAADPYHDAADPSLWTSFALAVDAATFPGFAGGTFDGRYVYASTLYAVPYGGGGVVRYDTQGDASFDAGWQTLVLPPQPNYIELMPWGAVYDGVSVTLVPGDTRTVPSTYPTSAPFDPSSITTVAQDVWWDKTKWTFGGFCGGAAIPAQDGGASSIILAPYESWNIDGSGPSNTVALYDGQSWRFHALYEPASTNAPGNFCGAVFDGQYVYLVPSGGYGAIDHVRLNTKFHASLTDSFADVNAWEMVPVGAPAPAAPPDAGDAGDAAPSDAGVTGTGAGFFGGVFDGRYVYYVPFSGSVVARFDTQGAFTDRGSWQTFDLSALAKPAPTGFQGGAFDGRFVYLLPTTTSPSSSWPSNPRPIADAGVPPLVRYDTRDPHFTQSQPWQTVDLHSINPGVAGFTGGIFDGEYLYLVPAQGSTFLRFDARNPNGEGPPGFSHGSFF